MLAKLCTHLTFANVVALMALFVALSGGAYALTIPKNSVGAKQLKRNAVTRSKIKKGAVTSSRVKTGSLLARNFKPGQLPAGPRGPQGAQGERGPQGLPGQNATRLFAYIRDTTPGDTGTASVQYGSGVTGATDGTSTYLVTFNRSVVNCVVQATPGLGNPQGTSPIHVGDANVEVRVAIPATNNAAIGFTNNAGAQVDTSFLVTAFC